MHMHVTCVTNVLHAFVWKNSCGGSQAVLCFNEVQVTMCKQTEHLYVCMLHTVRQTNKAKKSRKVASEKKKHEQIPCIQTTESSKPTSISVQKSCVAINQLGDSRYLLNLCE